MGGRVALIAAALLLLPQVSRAQVTMTGESELTAESLSPAWGTSPAVAAGSSGYLAAYVIGFDDPGPIAFQPLGPDGQPVGLPVVSPFSGTDVSLAFDGTAFVVLFQTDFYLSDVITARVDASGTVIAGTTTTLTSSGTATRLACTPVECLASWYHDWDLYAARLDASGALLDGMPITVAVAGDAHPEASLTTDGDSFFFTWTRVIAPAFDTALALEGQLVQADGTVVGTAPYVIAGPSDIQYDAVSAAAFDGANYLVIWTALGGGVYAVRMSPDGTVLDAPARIDEPIPLAPGVLFNYGGARHMAVAFDGTRYVATWEVEHQRSAGFPEQYSVYTRTVDTNGVPQGSQQIVRAYTDWVDRLRVTTGPSGRLLVWEDYLGSEIRAYGARVDVDGTVLDVPPISLSTDLSWQMTPSAAFASDRWMVVWAERETSGGLGTAGSLLASRIDATGALLDPTPFVVRPLVGNTRAEVAASGDTFLVVWSETGTGGGLLAARYALDGTAIDATPLVIAAEPTDFALAGDAAGWTVVYRRWNAGYELDGVSISPAGSVVSLGAALASPFDVAYYGLTSANGDVCAVWLPDGAGGGYDYLWLASGSPVAGTITTLPPAIPWLGGGPAGALLSAPNYGTTSLDAIRFDVSGVRDGAPLSLGTSGVDTIGGASGGVDDGWIVAWATVSGGMRVAGVPAWGASIDSTAFTPASTVHSVELAPGAGDSALLVYGRIHTAANPAARLHTRVVQWATTPTSMPDAGRPDGAPPADDAGAPDAPIADIDSGAASPDAAPPPPMSDSAGCGCSVGREREGRGRGAATAPLLALLALLCAYGVRRSFAQGVSRSSMRGKGMVSRTWWRPHSHDTVRSRPRPKPEWGTLP